MRGLPVIIGDSFDNQMNNESLSEFIENISLNMSDMIKEEACNLETNLILSKFASVGEALRVLSELSAESSNDFPTWFISFRNCKFKAVKLGS